MKPSEALEQVLELFGPNGEHWTQGYFARNSAGNAVAINSDEAVSWCTVGACERVTHNYDTRYTRGDLVSDLSRHFLRKAIRGNCITVTECNDSAKDFNEIREWFTGAIALAKAAGQ